MEYKQKNEDSRQQSYKMLEILQLIACNKSIILALAGVGVLTLLIIYIFSNDYVKNKLEKETLKVLKSEAGSKIIEDKAVLATMDSIKRTHERVDIVEKGLNCTNISVAKINETLIAFMAEIKADIKYLIKTTDENKK